MEFDRVLPLLVLPLLLLTSPADTIKPGTPPKPSPVKFTGDIGYVATSGNSSVTTLNMGDRIAAKAGRYTVSQQFSIVHGRSKGKVITSNWRAAVRTDAALGSNLAIYTAVTFERNTFAGLSSRLSSVSGLSAELVKSSTDRLVLEAGLSVTAQRGTATAGKDIDFMGGRAATAFLHHIGPRATVSQTIELLPNFHQSEDLRVNTETAVLAPLTRQVALKLSFVIRYDGLPEPGYLSTDRLFTSGVQISL